MLFKYRRDEGGWLARRLPHLRQSSAYEAIEVFKRIDPALFPESENISRYALSKVAKAEPDIQALIAWRVKAGKIFTAAEVNEIHDRPRASFVVMLDEAGFRDGFSLLIFR
ncbi:hypothetical protein [Rhizobium anhuiense]|uniref:hypothetical protein n=1 Tax=Rhizobium anhuiense TaxID=1184720 RepID=UPI0007B500EE|nr:hypothetical protein [Rhizobium anhuiense]KZS51657.1 hypothetical protein AS890_06715 [Rhizobium anhuiense bv. trifolii]